MNFEKLKNQPYAAFLYSGREAAAGCGLRHILAYGLDKVCNSAASISQENGRLYGYFGYNYRHQLENYPQDAKTFIATPDVQFMKLQHQEVLEGKLELPNHSSIAKVRQFESNMTDVQYLAKVADIIEKIKAGELYQANLTRKFFGEFETAPNSLDIFCALAKLSPAPYSAYIKMGDVHIISASPEKFLTMQNGLVTTIPIKGTLSAKKPASELAASQKDRAENLMIVDLMRNDLAKICKNVRVEKLFEVTSYPQYHHMSSTIVGETDKAALEVINACFPAGSMTGAPKIAAVNLCTKLENWERGIYSGALGWIEPNACDLSVVIRTIIIKDNKFEFQVGGGIVADSVPEKELQEIYVKSAAICQVLGLK